MNNLTIFATAAWVLLLVVALYQLHKPDMRAWMKDLWDERLIWPFPVNLIFIGLYPILAASLLLIVWEIGVINVPFRILFRWLDPTTPLTPEQEAYEKERRRLFG